MDWIFKKMGPAAALSLTAFTSIANAATDSQMRNLENRVNALEQKKGGNGGMINPPARPVVKDGIDLFVMGEVLIWKAREDNLNFATQLDAVPAANGATSGSAVNFKSKWNVGFRVGVGYNMAHDGWDVALNWARSNSHNKTSDENECGCVSEVFQPVYYPKDYDANQLTLPPYVTEAQAKYWRTNLNLVDLELGREFFVSKWMTVRPHVGLRYMNLRQKQRFEYEGGNFLTAYNAVGVGDVLPGATEDFVFLKNNFWGIGLRAGLDSTWGLGAGVSIYGKLALSALWGKFKLSQSHTLRTSATEGTTASLSNFRDTLHVTRPMADLAIGLRYDTTFSNDSWGFGIWAGWEQHYLWSQAKFLKFVGDRYTSLNESNGDFDVGGVNIGMSVDF
ncbi:MAG: hypothetical protein HYX48_02335 [Chlamydiales bacterium]|nr:hypothetical protein [Chlamydiales bacterium]